ncbi:hypothetical protein AVEN_128285-1 [Araneus ventricosus]|uniref:Uncharacterized protein n=1 Tax=Araneus ventricosus TaxID=182803 RepID=A0A4Y2U1U6_ARAVE|nr:hypothetical protein AVEN_128285-1 [Araneus ventricosus]
MLAKGVLKKPSLLLERSFNWRQLPNVTSKNFRHTVPVEPVVYEIASLAKIMGLEEDKNDTVVSWPSLNRSSDRNPIPSNEITVHAKIPSERLVPCQRHCRRFPVALHYAADFQRCRAIDNHCDGRSKQARLPIASYRNGCANAERHFCGRLGAARNYARCLEAALNEEDKHSYLLSSGERRVLEQGSNYD